MYVKIKKPYVYFCFILVKFSKNPQKFIQISCSSKLENEQKMNFNDVWMRRDDKSDFCTIDEQYQFIEIVTNGVRMSPNAYCFRQPTAFVGFLGEKLLFLVHC